MKSLYLFILLCALLPLTVCAQNRAVAIVYDNSGSMRDAGQCDGINYALQVMVGLLHQQDELYVYKMDNATGNFINLSAKSGSMSNIAQVYDCRAKSTPFDAVINAKNKLSASSKREKWLIILSDGMITDKTFTQKYPADLRSFVEQSGSRILFLNVNKQRSPLDDYFSTSATPQETLQTGGSFEQIIGTMEKIGARVMTSSGEGAKGQAQGNTLRLDAPIPLKKIIILQQEARKNATLPRLTTAKSNSKTLYIENSLLAQKSNSDYQMTGFITHVQADASGQQVIGKGILEFGFQNAVDMGKTKIFPEAAAKLVVDLEGSLKSKFGNQRNVCDTIRQIRVIAQLLDLDNKPLDIGVLQTSRVVAINENTKQKTPLQFDPQTNKFFASIPLQQKQTVVSVSAEYAGYFNFQSQVISINKDVCPIPKASISANKRNIRALVTDMANAETLVVSPLLSVDGSEPRAPTEAEMKDLKIVQLNETNIGVSVEERDGKLLISPAASWCACFTSVGKDSVILELQSSNKNILVGANKRLTVQVEIIDAPFWAKCGWLILSAISLGLGIWYIVGLIKKPRFCRGSEVVFSRITQMQTQKPRSYPLPTGFASRYLIPYIPEKQVVGTVKFKAGSRCSHILIDRDAQTENMFVSGFPIETPRQKDMRLSNGEKLEVSRAGGSKEIYEYRKL